MLNENIIDVMNEWHKDIPITLQGEVLLERTYDNNDNLSGYITTRIENIQNMKSRIETEGTKCYEYKYKNITDTF